MFTFSGQCASTAHKLSYNKKNVIIYYKMLEYNGEISFYGADMWSIFVLVLNL